MYLRGGAIGLFALQNTPYVFSILYILCYTVTVSVSEK